MKKQIITGLASNYRHNKYGWTDVNSADVMRIKEGWTINIDKPQILK